MLLAGEATDFEKRVIRQACTSWWLVMSGVLFGLVFGLIGLILAFWFQGTRATAVIAFIAFGLIGYYVMACVLGEHLVLSIARIIRDNTVAPSVPGGPRSHGRYSKGG